MTRSFLRRGQRFTVGPWGGCDANCTCGLDCPGDALTKVQRRDTAPCAAASPSCTPYSAAPSAERLCAVEPCKPCNAPGSPMHGSICSAGATVVDSASGLLRCSANSDGAPVCECRRGWRGARCHIRSAQGLLDADGAACSGVCGPGSSAGSCKPIPAMLYVLCSFYGDRVAATAVGRFSLIFYNYETDLDTGIQHQIARMWTIL